MSGRGLHKENEMQKLKLKVSKNVRHGRACAIRGDKLVLAGTRTKRIAGLWQNGYRLSVLNPETGDVFRVDVPTGLQTYGPAMADVFALPADVTAALWKDLHKITNAQAKKDRATKRRAR